MRRATFWGLILALVVPNLAYYPLSHFLGTAPIVERLELLAHWLNLAAILAIVVLAERKLLTSIGVRPFRWWTVPAGLLAGLAIMAGSGVLVYVLRLHGNQQVTQQLMVLRSADPAREQRTFAAHSSLTASGGAYHRRSAAPGTTAPFSRTTLCRTLLRAPGWKRTRWRTNRRRSPAAIST